MNPRLRTVLIIIGTITLIAIAIILVPRGLSLYYQIKGGQQIEYVLRFEEGINELVCKEIQSNDEDAFEQVDKSVTNLKRAITLNQRNARAYDYLGRANCLLGNYDSAIQNYLSYTQLKPKNQLGYIGLGFAYEAACLFEQKTEMTLSPDLATTQYEVCEKANYQNLIKQAWKDFGIHSDDFLINATTQFSQRRYIDALQWYSLGYRNGAFQLQDLSDADKLNWAISGALSDGTLPNELKSDLPLFFYADPLLIEVEDMRWLRSIPEWDLVYGDPVNKFQSKSPGIGTLYWNGRVISIVQFDESANYEFEVRGINSTPAPIILSLEINFKPIKEIRFEKGNDSHEVINFQSFIKEGIHIISLNFINNETVDGIDRNANIDFIKMVKLPDME